MTAPETYRVLIRLPIPVDHMERICDAFHDGWVLTEHDEGPGVMVIDVPVGGGS